MSLTCIPLCLFTLSAFLFHFLSIFYTSIHTSICFFIWTRTLYLYIYVSILLISICLYPFLSIYLSIHISFQALYDDVEYCSSYLFDSNCLRIVDVLCYLCPESSCLLRRKGRWRRRRRRRGRSFWLMVFTFWLERKKKNVSSGERAKCRERE